MRWTICLHESLHNWIVKFVMIMRILLKSCLRNQALKLNSVTVEIGFKKIRNVSKVRLEIAKYLKKKQIELKELSKDHEMEVRIIWTFIRFIHKTDFCTFVKTRCIESENVSVTLSYSILLQRDSKIWWNICWV